MAKSSGPVACFIVLFGASGCDDDSLFRELEAPDSGTVINPPPPPPPPPPDSGPPPPPDAGMISEPDSGVPIIPAREPVYIHTGSTLFSYDSAQNRAVEIGPFRSSTGDITDMVDIAIDLTGAMYGGSRAQDIFLVDPLTARCVFLSSYDDRLNGLTFISDGRLVVAGERVSIVDPRTGRMIQELVPMNTYETSGDIVGLPDGFLYWTVRTMAGGDALVRIDPRSGSTTYLGEGTVGNIFGLGYAADVLYGFSSVGVAVTISRTTGAVINERTLAGRWWGATTNPVLWE